jgi:HSP20 family protein
MDVYARDGDLVVRVELPGIDPQRDVTIEVDDRELVVRGERRRQEDADDRAYYRLEATYGAFERRVPLPEGVDENAVTASFEDGVLEIVVPKPEAAERSKVIDIPIVQGGVR